MVAVDVAHLKSTEQGKMFTMAAYGSNNHVTIIAFSVDLSEDTNTWS